jgi:hypothetical protein
VIRTRERKWTRAVGLEVAKVIGREDPLTAVFRSSARDITTPGVIGFCSSNALLVKLWVFCWSRGEEDDEVVVVGEEEEVSTSVPFCRDLPSSRCNCSALPGRIVFGDDPSSATPRPPAKVTSNGVHLFNGWSAGLGMSTSESRSYKY